ncbi:MAG TPA: hypothetical protein VIX37_00800 [Candidatus Sulfotelmatobacter sp.]
MLITDLPSLPSQPVADWDEIAPAQQSPASIAQKPGERSFGMHDHSCCPGVHSRFVLPVAVIPSLPTCLVKRTHTA